MKNVKNILTYLKLSMKQELITIRHFMNGKFDNISIK